MNSNEIDVMTVNETDLYGMNARIIRAHHIDEDILRLNLHLEGYRLWLPRQWEAHNQARVVMYTKEELNVQKVKLDKKYDDLPLIVLDVNHIGAKKTRICGFYREYKSSISGFDSPEAQQERFPVKWQK